MQSLGVAGSDWWEIPAFWAYGVAAIAHVAFSLQLAMRWRGAQGTRVLIVAIMCGGVWCAANAVMALQPSGLVWLLGRLADALRYGALGAFAANVLKRSRPEGSPTGSRTLWTFLCWALPLALFAMEGGSAVGEPASSAARSTVFTAWLALAVIGLVATEQIYRRTTVTLRWHLRPLCIALICIFGYDIVFHSSASLFRSIDPDLWAARGVVHSFAIPLLGMAAARNKDWTFDVAVSRDVLIGTVSLLVAGGYLLLVAIAGYVLRVTGSAWSSALQPVLLSGALLLLLMLLLSGTFRSRLRVFVAKHFFAYRYDYRAEWLRFAQTLAAAEGTESLYERCVRALADLVESSGGALWLRQADVGFVQVISTMRLPRPPDVLPPGSSVVQFLTTKGWILDLNEVVANPGKYPSLELPDWLRSPNVWLLIPLLNGDELIGFAVLVPPRVRFQLDWEVLDLLKTAARGAASYLVQAQATEALLEARKFDAFNRMSAFIVHDLKNLVAQLQLLLRNAEKHGGKAEFQRDMVATVAHVRERMSHMMQQLRTGAEPVRNPQPVDLGTLLRRIQTTHVLGHRLDIEAPGGAAALGHEDRLERIIGHLVQNALDASGDHGRVKLRVHRAADGVVLEVEDEGSGMTADFIREQLFRPFRSTKAGGMGLGAYESMQYIKSLGGSLAVASEPNAGTTMTIQLRAMQTAPQNAGVDAQ